jgi:hypothetical protein
MGTHAFPRVTSVNPGACEYNSRDEPCEGDLLHSTRPSECEPGRPLQEYPRTILKPKRGDYPMIVEPVWEARVYFSQLTVAATQCWTARGMLARGSFVLSLYMTSLLVREATVVGRGRLSGL